MKTRLALLALLTAAAALPQEVFSVIVQKDNPAVTISKTELRRMLLGEASWPGGLKLMVLFAPVGNAARTAMLKQICGMTEGDFAKYVLKMKFEGGNKSVPKTLASTAAILDAVQANPGALGIVEAQAAGDGVKILPVE